LRVKLDDFAFFLNNVTADMTPTQWGKFCKAAMKRKLFSPPFLSPLFTERVRLNEAKALRDDMARDLGYRSKNPEVWFAKLLASLNQLELKTEYRCMPLRLYGKPHPGQIILKVGKTRFVPLVSPKTTTPRELLYGTLGETLMDGTLDRLKTCESCKKWKAKKKAGWRFCSDRCRDAFHYDARIKSGYFKDYQKGQRAAIRRAAGL
jgi:hypothetical protein